MSIALPTSPGVQVAKPRLLDFGAWQQPPMGGPAQRLGRLGNRYEIDITFPSMRSDVEGMVMVSRLQQALTQGAIVPFPQDFNPGSPGNFVVAGAGQQGSVLNVHGGTANYAFHEGQFFSIIFGGRRYLHCVAAATTAGNDSTALATLSIVPMLRISPNDGAVCEFGQPMIEGYFPKNQIEWAIQTAPFNDVTLTLREVA
jgi:hypothetical protein